MVRLYFFASLYLPLDLQYISSFLSLHNCFRLRWSTLGPRSPVGMRTLLMFTMSLYTLRPQIPSSIWSTTILLASPSSSVRETWRLRSCRRGWYQGSLGYRYILCYSPSVFVNSHCVWLSYLIPKKFASFEPRQKREIVEFKF